MAEPDNNQNMLEQEALQFTQSKKVVSVNLDKMLMNVAYDIGGGKFLIASQHEGVVIFEEFERNNGVIQKSDEPTISLSNDDKLEKSVNFLDSYINLIKLNEKVPVFKPAEKSAADAILLAKNLTNAKPEKLPEYIINKYNELIHKAEPETGTVNTVNIANLQNINNDDGVLKLSGLKLGVLYRVNQNKFLFAEEAGDQINFRVFSENNDGGYKGNINLNINKSAHYNSWSDEFSQKVNVKELKDLKLVEGVETQLPDYQPEYEQYNEGTNYISPYILSKQLKQSHHILSKFPSKYKNGKLYQVGKGNSYLISREENGNLFFNFYKKNEKEEYELTGKFESLTPNERNIKELVRELISNNQIQIEEVENQKYILERVGISQDTPVSDLPDNIKQQFSRATNESIYKSGEDIIFAIAKNQYGGEGNLLINYKGSWLEFNKDKKQWVNSKNKLADEINIKPRDYIDNYIVRFMNDAGIDGNKVNKRRSYSDILFGNNLVDEAINVKEIKRDFDELFSQKNKSEYTKTRIKAVFKESSVNIGIASGVASFLGLSWLSTNSNKSNSQDEPKKDNNLALKLITALGISVGIGWGVAVLAKKWSTNRGGM